MKKLYKIIIFLIIKIYQISLITIIIIIIFFVITPKYWSNIFHKHSILSFITTLLPIYTFEYNLLSFDRSSYWFCFISAFPQLGCRKLHFIREPSQKYVNNFFLHTYGMGMGKQLYVLGSIRSGIVTCFGIEVCTLHEWNHCLCTTHIKFRTSVWSLRKKFPRNAALKLWRDDMILANLSWLINMNLKHVSGWAM